MAMDSGSVDSKMKEKRFLAQRLRRIVGAMSLARVAAVILTVALFLQSGCDFWCHHAEEVTATQDRSTAVPPCHEASEESQPAHHSDTNGPKSCDHPQATDDGSKLLAKVIKAYHPLAATSVAGVQSLLQFQEASRGATAPTGGQPSGVPFLVLRI
jgi:hypothetical protein